MAMSEPAPMSPCINLCTLDLAGVCIGCFRSVDEITRWTSMSAAERWRVIEAAERRRRGRPAVVRVVND
jgi:predicted Fe-S protein YdhL (DUF1289 family)